MAMLTLAADFPLLVGFGGGIAGDGGSGGGMGSSCQWPIGLIV